jgi:glycosyltransferase involved in cell wall biosynthesis
MQWRALDAAGVPTLIACGRGSLRFWLRTGVRARRRSVAALERMQAHGAVVVDHGLCVPSAELVFVHNLAAEASRHLPREGTADAERREREFFRALNPAATVVANSKLVAGALHEHFDLARERVAVLYPGYRRQRFSPQRAAELRGGARAALGIDEHAPLVGLVTSGDFTKRGLDLFLDTAARISRERPDARFLVVGSKELPADARAHALVRDGFVSYRRKCGDPERWFAALDLFLYPARFEEFGMVLAEAQAMGVPVLTSRLVGASECLPGDYAQWLLDGPDPEQLAARAVALLANAELRGRLAAAAAATVVAFDDDAYGDGTCRLLAAQNRLRK